MGFVATAITNYRHRNEQEVSLAQFESLKVKAYRKTFCTVEKKNGTIGLAPTKILKINENGNSSFV